MSKRADAWRRIQHLQDTGQIGIPTSSELRKCFPSQNLLRTDSQLATAYFAAAVNVINGVPVDKTKIWTDEASGMKIIVDPDMPVGSFRIGYENEKVEISTKQKSK